MTTSLWATAYFIGVAVFLMLHEELMISVSMRQLSEKRARGVMWTVVFLWPVILMDMMADEVFRWLRGEDPDDSDDSDDGFGGYAG